VRWEAHRDDLADRHAHLGPALERGDPGPVGRQVDRAADAGVVERPLAHVEEHPVGDRHGVAVDPAGRPGDERREAVGRDVGGEEVREDRDVGVVALDLLDLALRRPPGPHADVDPVGKSGRSLGSEPGVEARVADEATAAVGVPRGDAVRPGPRWRPVRRRSDGGVGRHHVGEGQRELVEELAVRPLQADRDRAGAGVGLDAL
jgi:hypothetical protein